MKSHVSRSDLVSPSYFTPHSNRTLFAALFRLKVQNVALVALVPTFLAKRAYNEDVEKRLTNMWRTHKNRVDRGLGGTYKEHGHHESLLQDSNTMIPNAHWSAGQLWEGAIADPWIDNPFFRWHESYEKYPSLLDSADDYSMYQTDEFDRFKKFKALDKHVVGTSPVIPREDNDEKWEYYDIQGESLYSHPPDPNTILVDHGLDEERLWSFGRTPYNQEVVKNPYTAADPAAFLESHAPQWGLKLSMPHFYKPEKMEKFHRHWGHRLGLQALMASQAVRHGPWPTEA